MSNQNEVTAQSNFSDLNRNSYPGRGIVVGLDQAANVIQVYWIMGRSPDSRNRVFKSDETGRLYTEAVDATKVKDPALIIYNAMRDQGQYHIVSNGNQTDTVAEFEIPFDLSTALRNRVYEPDPSFTPRITAVSSSRRSSVKMSILRKSVFDDSCDRLTYELTPSPGFGYCITTYAGDGNPLPSFCGDPLIMPLRGGSRDILDTYWQALNEENRVSLAVKLVDRENDSSHIYIINKYTQIG
ncbi:MAG: inosine monophosphate cyclohydrolase [Candidatus Andersenbacteria bacterium]|nr:inosine monophosphate cyclohydrolase [Candidatus Andersenbacteria bacterium]MBI3250858.1 inosine monophosphate cyclohydrolase [Candidatus Andersenbacteria bacterium]